VHWCKAQSNKTIGYISEIAPIALGQIAEPTIKVKEDKEEIIYHPQNLEQIKQNITKHCNLHRSIIEIKGIGGSGKTSLACQISKWLLDNSKYNKKRIVLPIIWSSGAGKDLSKWAQKEIATIIGSYNLSETFVKLLIQSGKILIIADGISEASNEERISIVQPELIISSLLITYRRETNINWGRRLSIELEPINTGENRIYFLTQYFLSRTQVFSDNAYQILLKRLSQICGYKNVTPAILKLFSEYAISLNQKYGTSALNDLPTTFPKLLKEYILSLCSSYSFNRILSDEQIIEGIQIIAFCSLDEKWRPVGTTTEQLSIKFKKLYFWNEKKVNFLLSCLRESGLIYRDAFFINLWIDPATEYLSSLYILGQNRSDKEKWEFFLSEFESTEDIFDSIGFLVSLYDVVNSDTHISLPTEIIDRIGKLSGKGEPATKLIVDQLIRDIFDNDQTKSEPSTGLFYANLSGHFIAEK